MIMSRRLLEIAFLLLPAALPGALLAQTDPVPDRIEEDWQVVVAAPTADGPHISTSMTPGGGDTAPAAIFSRNYRDQPNFRAGELQVKVLSGSQVGDSTASRSQSLATENETISWTQRLGASDGGLTYTIRSGHSTTWGDFGTDDDALSVSVPGFSVAAYKPDDSIAKSGVSFQANRVTSMTLLQVRYYQGGNLLRTDDTARPLILLPQ
jgi:hypothetical protein